MKPLCCLALLICAAFPLTGQTLRLSIIGTDTSHAPAYANILHDASRPDHVPGARIVAAFPGGSPDIESSASRVEGFAKDLKEKHGVKIVSRIADLCAESDGILLLSVDGRKHLSQFKEAMACKKPVFIDKPYAATWKDALEIRRLAKEAGIPWFSTSSLRYADYVVELTGQATKGAVSWGPGPLENHHELDLGWYAIHPIEALFTIMGPGCKKVSRTTGTHGEVLTGEWGDGRIGVVRTLWPAGGYGAVAFGEKDVKQSGANPKFSYAPSLKWAIKMIKTGKAPLSNDVTMEIFAFMEAANRSRKAGGAPQALPTW